MDEKLGLLAPPPAADSVIVAAFDELRTAITKIKYDRNTKVAHEGCVTDVEYDEARRNIRRFAVACVDKCGLFDAAWREHLEAKVEAVSIARFTVHDLHLPCRSLNEFVERSQRKAVTLTKLQSELLDNITESIKLGNASRRFLIQAPSGSGKTIVCTRLVARFIVDRLTAQSGKFFTTPTLTNATAVLITHSVALVEESAHELAASLTRSTGFDTCSEPMRECPLPGHGVAVYVAGRPELQVHVMTIDGFIKTVRARAASESLGSAVGVADGVAVGDSEGDAVDDAVGVAVDAPGSTVGSDFGEAVSAAASTTRVYDLAVVDEGHLVFSYQPYTWLDGQHVCRHATDVCKVLESALVGQNSTAPVVVVHDSDYQVNARCV
jgi:hypothetical protein